uniref:Uncharacterized protein n=1 Tax=Cacopsylla melanoneura TaxID=428564 RepID=A0A8D8VU24_9HEMI
MNFSKRAEKSYSGISFLQYTKRKTCTVKCRYNRKTSYRFLSNELWSFLFFSFSSSFSSSSSSFSSSSSSSLGSEAMIILIFRIVPIVIVLRFLVFIVIVIILGRIV